MILKFVSFIHTYLLAWDRRAIGLHQRPLYILLAGLVSGVLFGTTAPLSPALIALILLFAAGVWWPWPYPHLQRCCRWLLAGLIFTHLAFSWQQRALPLNHIAHHLSDLTRQRIRIEGVVDRPLDTRRDRQYMVLRLQRLYRPDTHIWHAVVGRVRLKIHATDATFFPGDRLQVERLRLHPVRNFQNPGHFDFRGLMHRRGIYAVGGISRPERIHLLERPKPGLWGRWDHLLAQWRRQMRHHIQTHLPPTAAAVFAAIVLGQRGSLTPDIEDAFRVAGLAHVLVVSGLHVGFVGLASFLSLRTAGRYLRSWAPRSWLPAWRPTPSAALISLTPLLLYCSLVGWKISTTRAALMACSYLLALAVSRLREPLHAVCLAAVLVLIFDPAALTTLGFQLSFVAVTMILLVSRRLPRERPKGWYHAVWRGGLASTAAFMGTLPLLANTFHTLPIYSPIANVILLPIISLLVPAGVVALLLATLWPLLAPIVFAPLAPLLHALIAGAQFVAAQPGAQVHIAALPTAVTMGYYGLLVSLLLFSRRQRRWVAISLCGLLMVGGAGWAYLTSQANQLRITFLDVGTGDAILIQTPENHHILIDGGGTYNGQFDIGARVIAPVLWQRYIGRFDLMAITHMHPNHARGLASLFHLFGAHHLLTNGSPLDADYLQDMTALARQRGIPIHTAQTGPRHWQWGRLQLTVLSPPPHASSHQASWSPPTENDRSLVLRLQYGEVRILLTGDIQHATEQWLATHIDDLRADILHIPHHGSRTSTHPDFIERVQPAIGIITAGSGNPYGHPHPRVLETLSRYDVRVFRTDRHGAITITSDGTQYHIRPFRPYTPPRAVHIPPSP